MEDRQSTSIRAARGARDLAEEKALVQRAQKDPAAFGKLFDRYYDDIHNYIIHRTANIALAQELTSNTFYKALNKLWMFRWKGVPFSAWLYRIASNEVNGFYRKYKQFHLHPIEDYDEKLIDELTEADREILAAEEQLANDVMFVELHKCIATLKPRYQEVITLRFFEGRKIAEIASILGKSEGTVKSLLHRSIAKLREILDKKEQA